MHLIRGALSRGPAVASHIEALAEKKGFGSRQLETAKELLSVTARRLGDGMGVCYFLPSQAADADRWNLPPA